MSLEKKANGAIDLNSLFNQNYNELLSLKIEN